MLPHLRQEATGTGAVHERRREVHGHGDAAVCQRGRNGRPRLRLADVDLRLGRERVERARDPRRQPAATPRDEHGIDAIELLDELEPDRAVTGHHGRVLHRVDEEPLHVRAQVALLVCLHGSPPLLPRHADDSPAEALDGGELARGGVVGNDDRGRDAELARHPRDALRHVPRARRHEPFRESLARRAQHGVGRPAQLEGADRLQVLELQPDLCRRVVELETHERSSDDRACDALTRRLDVRERDQKGTSTPMPCSLARRTTSSAEARSSTAMPSDLKTVSSSSCSRPGCPPTSTSPSSALM